MINAIDEYKSADKTSKTSKAKKVTEQVNRILEDMFGPPSPSPQKRTGAAPDRFVNDGNGGGGGDDNDDNETGEVINADAPEPHHAQTPSRGPSRGRGSRGSRGARGSTRGPVSGRAPGPVPPPISTPPMNAAIQTLIDEEDEAISPTTHDNPMQTSQQYRDSPSKRKASNNAIGQASARKCNSRQQETAAIPSPELAAAPLAAPPCASSDTSLIVEILEYMGIALQETRDALKVSGEPVFQIVNYAKLTMQVGVRENFGEDEAAFGDNRGVHEQQKSDARLCGGAFRRAGS